MIPSDTCLPCGGTAVFNCTTTTRSNTGGGIFVNAHGGQKWKIRTPDGIVTNLSSHMPSNVPAGYELISPFKDEYTGIKVLNTNSNWNGTTLQCIAFNPARVRQQNDSAPQVTLKVGG